MLTKYLPIYGKIKSIASAGDSKMVSLSHDKGSGVYSLHSLDVHEIILATTQFQREENCVSIPLDGLAKNEDPLYVLASEDNNFLITENGIYTVDGVKQSIKKIISVGKVLFCGIINNVKSQDLALISNDELCIYSKKRTKYTKEQGIPLSGSATALSISTDGKWIAVGYENGTVEVFGKGKTKFSSAPDSMGSNPIQMHKNGSVKNLAIVRYEGFKNPFVVSFGADRQARQARVDELIPSVRATTGLHTGMVKGLVSNANTGRFYTVSQDGEAKAWLNTRKKSPPQTVYVDEELQSATFLSLSPKRTNRAIKKDRVFMKEGGKFIVVAGGNGADGSLHFIQLEEKSDDNATGGQLSSSKFAFYTGQQWVNEFENGDGSDSSELEEIQSHVIDVISGWGRRFFDSMVSFASDDNDTSIQEKAIEAISNSGSPAAQFKIQEIANTLSEESSVLFAIEKLYELENTLSTISFAQEVAHENDFYDVFEWMLSNLAGLAADDREARQLLEEFLLDDSLDSEWSVEIYDALYDIDSSIDSIILALDNSSLTEMALRDIYHKGHLGEREAQDLLNTYLNHEDSDYRYLALQLTLLRSEKLADFASAYDEQLHHDLYVTKTSRLGEDDFSDEVPEQPSIPRSTKTLLKQSDDILEELASNQYEDIASYGCLLATRLGSDDYLSAQLLFMSSDDSDVRRNAIQGLGELKDPRSEAGLIKVFCKDYDRSLRLLAFDSCQLKPLERAEKAMNSDYYDIRFKAVEELAGQLSGRSKSAAEKLVLQYLSKENHRETLEKLWHLTFQKAIIGSQVQTLTELATNPNNMIRSWSRHNIPNELKKRWNSKMLSAALDVDNPYEVTSWLYDLLWSRSKELQEHKADIAKVAISSRHSAIRSQALSYLQSHPSSELSSTLISFTADIEDLGERSNAFSASASLFSFLQGKTASGENKDTRKSTSFGRRFFKEMATSSYEDLQEMAIDALSEKPSGWRLTIVKNALKDSKANIRARAASVMINSGVLTNATSLLKSPHIDVRIRAIQHLCKIGEEKAVPAMKKILTTAPPNKDDTAYFTNNIYTEAKFEHDFNLWKNHMIWTLTSARQLRSKKVLPVVRDIVENADVYNSEIRSLAIETLGFCMGENTATDVKLLQKCLSSSISQVQQAAGIALTRVGKTDGLPVIWDSIDDKLKFEMLFALEDQIYVERSISDGASYTKELIQGFILQSLVRGGAVEYLTNGLVADDKDIALFCARALESSSDSDELLALMQRELNDWSLDELQTAYAPELSDHYHSVIDEFNTYYSFEALMDLNDRRRKIAIEEWSLVSRLLSDDDPRVRSQIAGLFYQFRVNGLNDDSFTSQLVALSERYLGRRTRFKKISVKKAEVEALAFNVYQRLLVDGNVDFSIRTEALHSYVQCIGNRSFKGKIKTQLRNLLLDEEIASAAFGYLWVNRSALGYKKDADLIDVLLESSSSDVQRMGISLMLNDEDVEGVQEIAVQKRGDVSELAYEKVTDWFYNEDKLTEERAFLDSAMEAKNSSVQQMAFDRILELYHEIEDEDEDVGTDSRANELEALLDMMKKGLNTSDKELKRQVVHKLGMNGVVDVLDEVLRRAKSETSWEQSQYYEALVAICDRTRDTNGSLSKSVKDVAPALVQRWFYDPTGTVDTRAISNALHSINDRSIVDELIKYLKSNGYDYSVYNLVLKLCGYDDTANGNWDSYSKEEKNHYKSLKQDDSTLIDLAEYYLENTEFYRVGELLNSLKCSIDSKSTICDFLFEIFRLPNTTECNELRQKAISCINWRLENRQSIDGTATKKAIEAQLIKLLEHRDKVSAYLAAQSLSTMGNGEGLQILLARATDIKEDEDIRIGALEALGRLSNPLCLHVILRLAGYNEFYELLDESQILERNETIQSAALSAFGALQDSKDSEALLQILIDNLRSYNHSKRNGAIKALAHFGEKGRSVLYEEYTTFWHDEDVRSTILEEVKSDKSNSSWLKELLPLECKKSSYYDLQFTIYDILKARDADDLYPDITIFKAFQAGRNIISELSCKADDETLMECSRFDFFNHNNSGAAEEFIDALKEQDTQRKIGRSQNYPQDVIFKQIIEEFNQAAKFSEVSQRIDFVQLFIPLSGPSNKTVLPLIQSARELWVALQSRRDLGDDTYESEQSSVEEIWTSLLNFASSAGASEVLACLQTDNVPTSMVMSLLPTLAVNKASKPIITKLLTHGELQVRSAAANLLQEQSVSDLSSVAQDVSAMFLLRDSSTTGMMKEAKNGSALAIHNLVQSGQANSLLKELSKVNAATQIKIVNAVAVLGTKDALKSLKDASKKGSKALKVELKKAIDRCEYRISKKAKFAKSKAF